MGHGEVLAEVADEGAHPARVLAGVGPAHGVALALVPQHGPDPAAGLDGDPGAPYHVGVQLRPFRPLGHPRAPDGAGHEGDGGAARAPGAEHGVGEGHPGADPAGAVAVDALVQRLPRLLPPQRGGQAEDGARGRAVRRHDAVPVRARDPAAAGHVGLAGEDEDDLVGRGHVGRRVLVPQRGGGGDEEAEEREHLGRGLRSVATFGRSGEADGGV